MVRRLTEGGFMINQRPQPTRGFWDWLLGSGEDKAGGSG